MVLELYLDLLSQPCRAVFLFAKKNNIPFMVKSIEMLKGQLFSEEFNKVNILRKVPVLKDGDFTLEESTAILLYLTRKYNTPSNWYPPDMKKRARVDEFLAWQQTNIRPCASKILWLRVVIPLFLGQQIPSEKVQDALEELNISLQKLEEKFLQDRPFIIGTEISLADLVAITELMQGGAALPPAQSPASPEGRRRGRRLGPRPSFAPSLPRRDKNPPSSHHALRGAGDQPPLRAPPAGPAGQAVPGGGRDSRKARGAGVGDGEGRRGHGGLRRGLRPGGPPVGLLGGRGGLGRAEPAAQRPLLRSPRPGARTRPGADRYPVLPSGALADREERDRHDLPVTIESGVPKTPRPPPAPPSQLSHNNDPLSHPKLV